MCIEPVGLGAMRVTTGASEADMGALIARRRRLPSLAATWRALRAEVGAQRHRARLWTTGAVCVGAAPMFMVAVAALRFSRRPAPIIAAGLLAMAAVGFLAAKLHSDAIAAPV